MRRGRLSDLGSHQATFYIAGGTLPSGAPSYVVRQADTDLLASLRSGDFCYVLNTRQIGKSSLMIRTAARLRLEGVRIAVLDLTAVGQNLSPEQWYGGLLALLGEQLGLEDELDDYWASHIQIGPMQRFLEAVRQVALPGEQCRPGRSAQPLVVFVDEVDAVLSLPFSADELFAGIRECYNRRALDPAYEQLTFCLIGVAAPTDLIADPRSSPFNIGRRIVLSDFTYQEALPLAQGLGPRGVELLARVLYWTNGHPFMTQRLCQAVGDQQGSRSEADVDAHCRTLFLSHDARDTDDNLAFVRNRLLMSQVDLAALLDLYGKVHRGRHVPNDDANPLSAVLRLSGIVGADGPYLHVRNRVYREVFDRRWILEHTPGAEIRRQRTAYRRGVLLASAVLGAFLIAVGSLGAIAIASAGRANHLAALTRAAEGRLLREADYARRLLYDSDVNLAQQKYQDADIGPVLQILRETEPQPGQPDLRSFEWGYLQRMCHRDLRTLASTGGPVQFVAYSPDGTRLAEGDANGSVTLWNTATWTRELTFRAHPNGDCHLAWSPDGRLLACSGPDKLIRLYNTGTGKLACVLRGHTAAVCPVAFSPDGKLIASGGHDNTVRIWSAANYKCLRVLSGHTSAVFAVAFSPDGKLLASGSNDDTARIWVVATGRTLHVLRGHAWYIYAAAFSPDGKTLATAGGDTTIRLWSAATGRPLGILRGHASYVYALAWSRDGTTLASAGWDNTARLWNTRALALVRTLRGHASYVWTLSFAPDGTTLATGSADGTIKVWNTRAEVRCRTIHLVSSAGVSFVQFSPDGARVLCFDSVAGPQLRNARTGALTLNLRAPGRVIVAASFTKAGRRVAEWDARGRILLLDSGTGRLTGVLPAPVAATVPTEIALAMTYSHSGRRLALGGPNGKAWICDASSGRVELTLNAQSPGNSVLSIAFSPDGKNILTGAGDQTVLWDARTGARLAALEGGWGAFSPDGTRIATGCSDSAARLWNAHTYRLQSTLVGHSQYLRWICWSPDGKRVVTASSDDTAKLWDADTGGELLTLHGHTREATCAVFAPDGMRIATASYDGTVKIWTANPWQQAGAP